MLPTVALARPERTAVLPVSAGIALIGTLVASAGGDDGLILCPFRRCTGGYCPGCGATRAANRFVRGDLAASWSHHPWVVLAAGQLLVLAVLAAFIPPAHRLPRIRQAAVPLLVANSVLMIAIWIVRLGSGAVPTGWL